MRIVIIIPNNRGALSSFNVLIPVARIAVISLSAENLPKAVKVDIKTAIGTASARIHAIL